MSCHAGNISDVTLAFEDAHVIPPIFREENDNKYKTDDIYNTDYTDNTDDTDDTDDADDTDIVDYTDEIGWNSLYWDVICCNRLE